MIIQRFTWKVKPGCKNKFIDLTKALVQEAGLTPRVWSFVSEPSDIVGSDLEFETEQDRQTFWDKVDKSKPAWVEWQTKGGDLTESDVSDHTKELLRVH